MVVVIRRPRLRLLVALVLALSARTVYAMPAQAEAELRAVGCCTQHTGRPSTVPDARRCCDITSDADAPVTMGAAPASAAPTAPLVAALAGPAPRAAAHEPCRLLARTTRDGPPRYLALQTLRR